MLKVAAVLLLLRRRRDLRRRAPTPGPTCPRWSPGRGSRSRRSASRCCSAAWPSPAPAAGRTWSRPTGSGTRASAWGRTSPAWSARSPDSPRPCRAPATSSSRREKNMDRWKGWWKFANLEQIFTFVLITFLTILFTSLLAYSTVFGREGLENNIGFIRTEGEVLGERVGSLVPVLLLGDRLVLAVRRRARHRGLHQPAGRRRAQDQLPAQAERVQDVRGAGLGPDRDRHRRAAARCTPSRSSCW